MKDMLANMLSDSEVLSKRDGFIRFDSAEFVTLDGSFSKEELQEVLKIMELAGTLGTETQPS